MALHLLVLLLALQLENKDLIATAFADDGKVEFADVLGFSAEAGSLVKPQSAKVLGTVVREGRDRKILVFHFKRKKQYKKLQGHRQGYTQVLISEIQVDGDSYKA